MQNESGASEQDRVKGLVRSAQEGHAEAFAGLYDDFYGKIYRYVLFKTGDVTDAEDITKDVFLKMLQSIGSFKWQGPPFSSWLFRIAHNLVVDHFRKKARKKTVDLEAAASATGATSYDLDSQLDLKLSVQQVYGAMEGLTELQKEVLTLRFAGGLSVQETSVAMRRKENAVKALQHAAIKKLRTILGTGPEIPADSSVPQWSP